MSPARPLSGSSPQQLLLGFILSGLLEENLRRTLTLADGAWSFLLERPAALVIALLCVLVWSVVVVRLLRGRGGGS